MRKYNEKITRYKAQRVAKGLSKRSNTNYEDTYFSIARYYLVLCFNLKFFIIYFIYNKNNISRIKVGFD